MEDAEDFDQIADEAIRDVGDKLRRFVLPKLEIRATSGNSGDGIGNQL